MASSARERTGSEAGVRLALPGYSRFWKLTNVVVLGLFGFFGLVVFGSLLGVAISTGALLAYALLLVLGVPCLLVFGWYAVRELQRIRDGAVSVGEGGLRIEQPALLREPLEVPIAGIRKAVVDDGHRWDANGRTIRFPVYDLTSSGSGSGRLMGALWGWLYEDEIHEEDLADARLLGTPYLLPSLDTKARAPNLALLFEPRVDVESLRGQRDHGPEKGEAMVGALLRVDDPGAARAALANVVTVEDLDRDDLDYLKRGLGVASNGSTVPVEREAEGDRAQLQRSRLVRTGWIMLLLSPIIPVLGLGAAGNGFLLQSRMERGFAPMLFIIAGLGVFALRLYLWLS